MAPNVNPGPHNRCMGLSGAWGGWDVGFLGRQLLSTLTMASLGPIF